MLRLSKPIHSVPDNFWHTLLILCVSAFFMWQTGQALIELFMVDGPVNHMEQKILEGAGHPFQLWLSSLELEEYPLLFNRIFSFAGWMFTLGFIIRILKRSQGFVGSLPSFMLLFALPGFSVFMCSAGSGSWAIYFFLKAFATVSENKTRGPLIRGGVFAAIATLFSPIWFLPSIGLLAGGWEIFRLRVKWVALGFVVTGFIGLLLFLIVSQEGLGYLLMGPAGTETTTIPWPSLLHRYLFLFSALFLLLAYGARRRGIGWWSLVLCLPLFLVSPLLDSTPGTLFIPLWTFICLGLAKLPVVVDVRFPRAYQSLLLCQLLLWLPAYLGFQPLYLYSVLSF